MTFYINNIKWKIKEKAFKVKDDDFIYGYCDYTKNTIYINKGLCEARKRQTLIHELMHCWTNENGWGFDGDVDRETLCNIVAASHDFVSEVLRVWARK